MTPWSRLFSSRAPLLALAAAGLGALGCVWSSWCEFPYYAWNEVRLAPAFALRYGINPYPPLGGGPLSTWIYGPVGMFVNLPATLASSPAGALHLASLVNATVVLGPLALIFFGSAELRARGMTFCALAFALAVLLVPRPNLILQVPDHSAIAFGLLSCWCLARTPDPGAARLAVAAGLCALSVWSKQIEVFLLAAQLVFLFTGAGARTALRYFGWFALFSILALAVFAAEFGLQNLWLNMFAIPGRLPWAEFMPRLQLRPLSLVAQVAVPIVGLVVLRSARLWRTRERESGRFFQLGVLAFLALLPVGLLAFFKIGGDTNLLHSWDYLMPAALLAWLAGERTSGVALGRLVGVTAFAIGLRGSELMSLPVRPSTGHFATAAKLTALYPHAIWFPQNPLITFYADHRLWHSEDGVFTRFLAGYPLREPDFRRYLPAPLAAIVYPGSIEFPSVLSLLPEYNRAARYPNWTVHSRAPPPPP